MNFEQKQRPPSVNSWTSVGDKGNGREFQQQYQQNERLRHQVQQQHQHDNRNRREHKHKLHAPPTPSSQWPFSKENNEYREEDLRRLPSSSRDQTRFCNRKRALNRQDETEEYADSFKRLRVTSIQADEDPPVESDVFRGTMRFGLPQSFSPLDKSHVSALPTNSAAYQQQLQKRQESSQQTASYMHNALLDPSQNQRQQDRQQSDEQTPGQATFSSEQQQQSNYSNVNHILGSLHQQRKSRHQQQDAIFRPAISTPVFENCSNMTLWPNDQLNRNNGYNTSPLASYAQQFGVHAVNNTGKIKRISLPSNSNLM